MIKILWCYVLFIDICNVVEKDYKLLFKDVIKWIIIKILKYKILSIVKNKKLNIWKN